MTDTFYQISELERLGDFEKIIKLVETEIKTVLDPKRRFRLEIAQLEANYNLRNFLVAKKEVELLINSPEIENFPGILGDAHNLLGKIFRIHQRYKEALNHYRIAENAYQNAQDSDGLTKIYINMGNTYIFLERFKEAKKFHEKALDLAKLSENSNLTANCFLNLGSLHYQNGEVEKALNYYRNALKIFETINDLPALAAVHLNIAESLFLRKKFSGSSKYSATAVQLYKQQKNTLGIILALKSFARAEKGAEHYEEAAKSYEELLKYQDTSKTEDVLLELGECYLGLHKFDSAKEIFQTIRKTPNFSLQSRGFALNSLAILSAEKRNFGVSIKYYEELLAILEALPVEDSDSTASTYGNLGFMHLKINNIEDAHRYLETALAHFKKKKIWDESIVLLNNFNTEFAIKGEYDRGISAIQDHSLPIAKKAKDKNWQNHLHFDLAFFYHLSGKSHKGIRYLKKHLSSVSVSKYRPKFITAEDMEESEKQRLEEEYTTFLKMIPN